MDAEAVTRVSRACPCFGALSDAERTELVAHLRARRFSRDEVVFHRDDACGHRYVILSGSVKIAIRTRKGTRSWSLEAQGAIAVGRRHITVKEPALLRKQVRY